MLDSTGQTGMITVNYSYARYGLSDDPVAVAASYAAEWVKYDNGRTKYWEIGNENSGPWQAGYRINTETNKDGQPDTITGGLYGQHFVVFANAMRAAAAEIGHEIYIGAQLIQYDAENTWNPPEKRWNELYFNAAGDVADFYIVHSYYTPYNQDSPVEVILNSARTETKNMMDWMRTTTSLW
jgi:alpha-L-arabinofuranosidase